MSKRLELVGDQRELSQNGKNTLALVLMYLVADYPDVFSLPVAGDLTPLPEYLANDAANARQVREGLSELWEFASHA